MTAIFAHSDTMAIGVLSALASAGRRVPADVAVVSCDDMPFAEYLTPSLSSLRVPFAETGQEAVELLLRSIAGESAPESTVRLPVELIVRDSCGGHQATTTATAAPAPALRHHQVADLGPFAMVDAAATASADRGRIALPLVNRNPGDPETIEVVLRDLAFDSDAQIATVTAERGHAGPRPARCRGRAPGGGVGHPEGLDAHPHPATAVVHRGRGRDGRWLTVRRAGRARRAPPGKQHSSP